MNHLDRAYTATVRILFASVCLVPLAILMGDRACWMLVAFLVGGMAWCGWPLWLDAAKRGSFR